MRKTKIVCTIGPASDGEDVMEKMCKAGMNVARLNFSHGTHEDYEKKIEKLVRVREKLGYPLAIMLDTKGPEYRIRTFKNGKVTLNEGDEFTFAADEIEGDNTRVSVSYPYLAEELAPGDKVLLNNGLMIFRVKKIVGRDLVCEVEAGGVLSDRKSMSFPNKVLKQKYLSEQDKADILFGVKHGVDYIACSFVSVKQDLIDIKNYLKEIGGEGIDLIAKIENRAGVENIEEICTECEGIMIGRGDMGVEIPYEELPAIQKGLITKCRRAFFHVSRRCRHRPRFLRRERRAERKTPFFACMVVFKHEKFQIHHAKPVYFRKKRMPRLMKKRRKQKPRHPADKRINNFIVRPHEQQNKRRRAQRGKHNRICVFQKLFHLIFPRFRFKKLSLKKLFFAPPYYSNRYRTRRKTFYGNVPDRSAEENQSKPFSRAYPSRLSSSETVISDKESIRINASIQAAPPPITSARFFGMHGNFSISQTGNVKSFSA